MSRATKRAIMLCVVGCIIIVSDAFIKLSPAQSTVIVLLIIQIPLLGKDIKLDMADEEKQTE